MHPTSRRVALTLATLLASVGLVGTAATSADAATKPYHFTNCTTLNAKFRHGIGRHNARDTVRGTTRPVTTFYRSDAWYKLNAGLDRDRDGVACEKR